MPRRATAGFDVPAHQRGPIHRGGRVLHGGGDVRVVVVGGELVVHGIDPRNGDGFLPVADVRTTKDPGRPGKGQGFGRVRLKRFDLSNGSCRTQQQLLPKRIVAALQGNGFRGVATPVLKLQQPDGQHTSNPQQCILFALAAPIGMFRDMWKQHDVQHDGGQRRGQGFVHTGAVVQRCLFRHGIPPMKRRGNAGSDQGRNGVQITGHDAVGQETVLVAQRTKLAGMWWRVRWRCCGEGRGRRGRGGPSGRNPRNPRGRNPSGSRGINNIVVW